MTRKMALEEGSMEALRREYLRLCEKFHRLKELARINLELLTVCLDLEQCPEAKVEFDKVNKLVQILLNEEIYEFIYPLKEELDEEENDQAAETEEPQNVKASVGMKIVKNRSVMVMKMENFKTDCDGEDNTLDTSVEDATGTQQKTHQTLHSVITAQPESLPPRKRLTRNQAKRNVRNSASIPTSSLKPVKTQKRGGVKYRNEVQNEVIMAVPTMYECKRCGETLDNRTLFNEHKKLHAKEDNTCNVCGKQFARKSDLNRHTPIHSREKLFTCKLCGKKFHTECNMKRHMDIHKADRPMFDCEVCGRKFTNVGNLRKHMATHTDEDNTCTICGRKYASKAALKFHTYLHSSEKPFLCNICGKSFHRRFYLKNHVKSHDSNRPKFYCEVCGKAFSSKNNLNRHMLCHHSKEKFKCDYCDKEYKTSSGLYQHKRQHTEQFPHQCQTCGNRYKTPIRLSIHERIHIGESALFTCSLCDATFTSKMEFTNHKTLHINRPQGKQYSCSKCPLQYKGLLAMAKHVMKHPDLTFCIFCQQEFQSSSEFQSHITTTHLVEKELNCSFCSEKFTSYYRLHIHEAYHTRPDPFKCQDCGKSYISKYGLENHRLCMHLKTKKYTCEHCGRNFFNPGNFRRHLKNHEGLKPYKCPVCGKEFSQKVHLETHSWTHRTDKRYQCETCGRGFNEKRAFMSHRKTQHQDIEGSSVETMNHQQTGDDSVEMINHQQTEASFIDAVNGQQAQASSADTLSHQQVQVSLTAERNHNSCVMSRQKIRSGSVDMMSHQAGGMMSHQHAARARSVDMMREPDLKADSLMRRNEYHQFHAGGVLPPMNSSTMFQS